VALLPGRRPAASPGQDVDLDAPSPQMLGELAHVPTQPPLDYGRVLPGDQQYAHRTVGR
jgi:hypothetical protein